MDIIKGYYTRHMKAYIDIVKQNLKQMLVPKNIHERYCKKKFVLEIPKKIHARQDGNQLNHSKVSNVYATHDIFKGQTIPCVLDKP